MTTTSGARAKRPAADAMQRPGVSISIDAFRRILRALRLAARKTQMTAGISAAQLFVLRSLEDMGEASLSELAERTMTDRTSVAAVIERLVDAGLVSREKSSDDARRAAVTITPEGRAALKKAPEAPTALLLAGFDGLSDERLAMLADCLTELTGAMGLNDQPAGMLFEDGADAPPKRSGPRRRRDA